MVDFPTRDNKYKKNSNETEVNLWESFNGPLTLVLQEVTTRRDFRSFSRTEKKVTLVCGYSLNDVFSSRCHCSQLPKSRRVVQICPVGVPEKSSDLQTVADAIERERERETGSLDKLPPATDDNSPPTPPPTPPSFPILVSRLLNSLLPPHKPTRPTEKFWVATRRWGRWGGGGGGKHSRTDIMAYIVQQSSTSPSAVIGTWCITAAQPALVCSKVFFFSLL